VAVTAPVEATSVVARMLVRTFMTADLLGVCVL
jgi:hypothetical protein